MIRLSAYYREHDSMHESCQRRTERFLLWIDAVGGYWVCLGDEVTIGQPVRIGGVDIPILGDLSGHHARIRRDGEGYLIEALRDVKVDGRPVKQAALLSDGDVIELGHRVRMVFRRPHALSVTARLDFVSRHRTQPSADAVVLMADTCVLGPKPHSHIVCRKWSDEVILYRHGEDLFCRSPGELEIDGRKFFDKGKITKNSRVAGERFAICLEEI